VFGEVKTGCCRKVEYSPISRKLDKNLVEILTDIELEMSTKKS
jgi:hypothetical protein